MTVCNVGGTIISVKCVRLTFVDYLFLISLS